MAKKVGDLKKLEHSHAIDTQIATGIIGIAFFSQQGLQQIGQALKTAKDPVQVIAHLIFIAMHQAREKLQQKGMRLDDKIWIAGGGVLDRVLFDLCGILISAFNFKPASDPHFVAAIKQAVLELMQSNEDATNEQQDGDEGGPEEEASESPQEEAQEQQQQRPKGGLLMAGGRNG